jgi:cytochrome P450
LIAARDGDERLNQQELLSTIFQLIVARHDTTTSVIGNSLVALLRNPELATLRAHPHKLPAAVEEFLRYDAPVPHSTFRYATEPIEIAGLTIPAGAQVIISLAANRDGNQYPSSSKSDRSTAGGCGAWRRGDDDRHPCFLTEREALAYMQDRLRRIAVFEH